MKHTLLIVLVLSTILPVMSEARTWHVEPDSTGQVINIQAGIDSAAAGDTVLAAPGTYIGDGNWDLDFNGKSIVVRSDGGARIFILDYSDEHHCGFHFHSGEDTAAVVEGIGITKGMGLEPGVLIEGASPTIRNNDITFPGLSITSGIYCENSSAIIENNYIYMYQGSGIHCRNSRALVKNNEVRVDYGSGIYCDSDSSVIMNNFMTGDHYSTRLSCVDSHNIIIGNEIGSYGSGMRCTRGSYEISNNRILGAYMTAGLVCDSCTTVISNNHIESNQSRGLVLNGGSHMISGNTIINNTGYGPGGVLFSYVDSNTVFSQNYVYSNAGGVFCYYASPIISDNVVIFNVYNESSSSGGGICCKHSSPLIIRNTIAYNQAERGAGIRCQQSSPRIENCIIAYNNYSGFALPFGYGIYCEDELSIPTIINCNVYGNSTGNYVGIPDQTGINGNFSLAPMFCDPENQEFTLYPHSPCLPGNHPDGYDCGLIGACGLGCPYDEPYISLIEDVGNDQGRQVSVSWYRSQYDSSGSLQPILKYEIYRRLDDLPSPPVAYVTEWNSPKSNIENRDVLAYPEGDWYFLTEVPAQHDDVYSMAVPTWEDSCVYNDSTAAGDPVYYSTFFIRAATSVPTTYYDSSPDSGYSVDNLAPSMPVGVAMTEGTVLQWDNNEEPDLGGYYIYGKVGESDEGVRIATIHRSEFDVTDSNINGGYHFWGVSAFDINGNESPREEIAWIPTDVEEPHIPSADYLSQNYPNPFNPSTTIYFGLKNLSDVDLRIFDVSGRLVCVLANGDFQAGEYKRVWDGKDGRGIPVASGVYFYRLVAGDFEQTKKMVLLR